MWNLSPPPGFQGLHPDKPLTAYHRHLPHWRQDGATYFVTYRLRDSLAQNKLRELSALHEELKRRPGLPVARQRNRRRDQPAPPCDQDSTREHIVREITTRTEQWLDEGFGCCILKHSFASTEVVSSMHHFDGQRYELDCYVVMPNHVHAILRPLKPAAHPLESILGSWKTYTSQQIHRQTQSVGNLWQEESFDRIIRDEEHLYRAIRYIGRNPANAGLASEACPLWLRPQWRDLGWTFE